MPNTRSAMKRMRSDLGRRLQNQSTRSELRTLTKKLQTLVSQEPNKAREFASYVTARFDKAASRGVIPKQRADRKKSRIAKLLLRSAK